MRIVISPAKKMDFAKDYPTEHKSQKKSKHYLGIKAGLQGQKKKSLQEMMGLSDALAAAAETKHANLSDTPSYAEGARPAIFAYRGDTYVGFDVDSLSAKHLKAANEQLRIISALYGALAPLDLIQPYRLEMSAKWAPPGHKSLASYWKPIFTSELKKWVQKEPLVILASEEYSQTLDASEFPTMVRVSFLEKTPAGAKAIGLYAKRARGRMARWIIETGAKTTEALKKFNEDRYEFAPSLSEENHLIFWRTKT